jgi:hypothetical protein
VVVTTGDRSIICHRERRGMIDGERRCDRGSTYSVLERLQALGLDLVDVVAVGDEDEPRSS